MARQRSKERRITLTQARISLLPPTLEEARRTEPTVEKFEAQAKENERLHRLTHRPTQIIYQSV